MTQEERWYKNYQQVEEFIKTHKYLPSRHRLEEHRMLNWLKATKKRKAAGQLPKNRLLLFDKLMAKAEQYKRLNQYVYSDQREFNKKN